MYAMGGRTRMVGMRTPAVHRLRMVLLPLPRMGHSQIPEVLLQFHTGLFNSAPLLMLFPAYLDCHPAVCASALERRGYSWLDGRQ